MKDERHEMKLYLIVLINVCILTPLNNLFAAAHTESSSSSEDEITRSLTPPEYEHFTTIVQSIEERGIHSVTIDQISNWITDAYMHDAVAQKVLEYLRRRLNNDKRIQRLKLRIEQAQPLRRRAGSPLIASEGEAIIIDNNRIAQLTPSELEELLQTLELGFKIPTQIPLFESSLISYINHAAKGTLDILQISPLGLLDLMHILNTPYAADLSPEQLKFLKLIQVLQAAIVNHDLKYNPTYNQIKYDTEQNAALEATDKILNAYYEESGQQRPDTSLIPGKKSFAKRWFTRNK